MSLKLKIDIDELVETFNELSAWGQPYVEWVQTNWVTIVLTGEIIGAVIAIKYNHWKRGLGWLIAALMTIWFGGQAT